MTPHTSFSVKRQLTLGFGGLALASLLVAGFAARSLDAATGRFRAYVEGVDARARTVASLGHATKDLGLAARNLLLASSDAQREVSLAAAKVAQQAIAEDLKRYNELVAEATDMSEKGRAAATELNRVERAYAPVALAVVELAAKGEHAAAIAKLNSECIPLLQALNQVLQAYEEIAKAAEQRQIQAAYAAAHLEQRLLFGAAGLALLLATATGWWLPRRLAASLGAEPADLSAVVGRVADGDLSPIEGAARAPVGSVLDSLGRMQASLVGIVGQIRSVADGVATASGQIASGNQDLSSRTEQQASALQQTAA
ncbi:MAG TPA: MCP four helix bundle domain-containing protein, partial [Burkholderiaceae bacterium]|nr:MCP four helix bundle domain-containing protein [Burkholderiaceae bacterium]